jgi:2,3,4,5-tetrahydropyridine-2,6-dicarboxylate N-succinyltransferase
MSKEMTKDRLLSLQQTIEEGFEQRDRAAPTDKWGVAEMLTPHTTGRQAAIAKDQSLRKAVEETLDLLDAGKLRVAERQANGEWLTHQWLKKAVLLSFRLNDNELIAGGPGGATWWDKVPSKFAGWSGVDFDKAGFRAVPNAIVRRSAYIAPGVVLMPSFVNLGAYVDSGTMVDTWATVGSPAPRSARTCISPAGSASAACWSRCRPARRSSRTTASSAPAPRWSKGWSSARAR